MRFLTLALLGVSSLLSAATVETKPDALVIAPSVYKLAFENERIRVLSFVTEPGQKWPLHSHPDSLAVSLSEYSQMAPQTDN